MDQAVETKCITIKDIKSSLAYCALRQTPEVFPRNLETVITKVVDACSDFTDGGGGFFYKNISLRELRELIKRIINDTPEIKDWNLSIAEKRKGLTDADDPSRPPFLAVSMYDSPKAEHDFIDLYALEGNVIAMIWSDQD